ncbi:hypothetical protein GJ496_006693 [Pomphorhynchus laevis]|nr:hypothetical protein GJ496_006693 [Pomphorhynchus laevis]
MYKKMSLKVDKSEIICVIAASLALQCIISTYDYSGFRTPPLYGDFEAHRHWMEITTNLNVTDWYRNTSDNDLSYWGIDYPPLAVYHSWALGYIVKSWLNCSQWIELHKSRGFESTYLKMFMRLSVICSWICTMLPAAILLSIRRDSKLSLLSFTYISINPILMIIDNGHFQYNCLPLGLSMLAVWLLLSEYWVAGTISYTCALFLKQMSAYYVVPIVAYCLHQSLYHKKRFELLFRFIFVGLGCATLLCLPYLLNSKENTILMFNRLIPIQRGVFEDKVANFWSTLNIFYKIRVKHSTSNLLIVSCVLTSIPQIPICVRISKLNILKCMFISSLCFYLFSFQVHEKSIVFPAVIAAADLTENNFEFYTWFLNIGYISLFPLIEKDDLCFIGVNIFLINFLLDQFLSRPGRRFDIKNPYSYKTLSILGGCLLASPAMKRRIERWISDNWSELIAEARYLQSTRKSKECIQAQIDWKVAFRRSMQKGDTKATIKSLEDASDGSYLNPDEVIGSSTVRQLLESKHP